MTATLSKLSIPDLPALILVGGKGTRLRPITGEAVPKPLANVCGRPFLSFLLDYLFAEGIRRVILAGGYLVGEFERFVSRFKPKGMAITISAEPEPLGTAGAIAYACSNVANDCIVVLNGDSICLGSLHSLLRFHLDRGASATIMLTTVSDRARYGAVCTKSDGEITHFVEKGHRPGVGTISAGVYMLNRSVVDGIPRTRPSSIERDIFPSWIGHGLYGYESDGPFIDIGTPESFTEAQRFFECHSISDSLCHKSSPSRL